MRRWGIEEEITLDLTELEHGRWFPRNEAWLMLARTHPDGLQAPVDMPIANLLPRRFVEDS